MITIPFIIILTILAVYQGKNIRKHNIKIYIAATIITIIAFLLRYKVPITEPLTQGYLGFSFLYIVMFAGALKNKSPLNKKLMGVRREYSIIGFILLSTHSLKYIIEFLKGDIRFEWFGVIPYAIMLPLFITSFMVFRKKFTFTTWKKIQQFAYIAYILIFVHLIIVAEVPNLIVYIILFTPYIILKLYKEIHIFKSNKA
jgi:DMSO/TMAO reductase YedYZ heme-binding membrane subunit